MSVGQHEFDPLKAIKEEISGLGEVMKVLGARERQALQALGEAEAELNSVRKLTGFASAEIDRKRRVLRQLETEAETIRK